MLKPLRSILGSWTGSVAAGGVLETTNTLAAPPESVIVAIRSAPVNVSDPPLGLP